MHRELRGIHGALSGEYANAKRVHIACQRDLSIAVHTIDDQFLRVEIDFDKSHFTVDPSDSQTVAVTVPFNGRACFDLDDFARRMRPVEAAQVGENVAGKRLSELLLASALWRAGTAGSPMRFSSAVAASRSCELLAVEIEDQKTDCFLKLGRLLRERAERKSQSTIWPRAIVGHALEHPGCMRR